MINIEKKVNEYRVPVFVCPHCGEKDRIGLTTIDRESNLNVDDFWLSPQDLPSHWVDSRTESVELSGLCAICHTTFEFKVSWTVPIRDRDRDRGLKYSHD